MLQAGYVKFALDLTGGARDNGGQEFKGLFDADERHRY